MSDEGKAAMIERREIIEDRANRDAFRLCVLILIVVAIGLVVLGIAAWNSRFMLMPIVPRSQLSTPRAESTPSSKTANRSATARGVVHSHSADLAAIAAVVEQTCGPVPLAVGADAKRESAKAIRSPHAANAAGSQTIFA